MTWSHSLWINALFVIIAIGGAEEVIRRLIGKPVARAWRKVDKFLDTWNGEPERDGLPARPGLVDRVIRIEYQVHNNGGGSMKDDVDDLKKTVNRIETASQVAAHMASAAKVSLDEHIAQSEAQLKLGQAAEADIRATISTLADAVKIAAQSTPPHEEEHS